MKLESVESREDLRSNVVALLATVPDNKKVQLPKETLEQLLFEEFEGKKLPVWSGEFLKKLDLSQVNFKGVCWDGHFVYKYFESVDKKMRILNFQLIILIQMQKLI